MGICNGCQLMAELGLVYPEHEKKHKMVHNDSHKFESNFVSLEIPEKQLRNVRLLERHEVGCMGSSW